MTLWSFVLSGILTAVFFWFVHMLPWWVYAIIFVTAGSGFADSTIKATAAQEILDASDRRKAAGQRFSKRK